MPNYSSLPPFTVLGIDASLTGTGLCVLTWDYFQGEPPKTTTLINDLKGVPRLLYIEKEVEKWACHADLIVIEDYAYKRKYRGEVLGELQGVLKRRLYLMEKEILVVTTQKVKRVLTGNGSKPAKYKHLNNKEWTIQETKKNYCLDFTGRDNECDAFGLALIGLFQKLYQTDANALNQYPLAVPVILQIEHPAPPRKKRTIHYYCKLPYKITVMKTENGTYEAYCSGLDYSKNGRTAKEAVDKVIKGKKDRIKELREKKVRIKTHKKHMGPVSFRIQK